MVNSSNEQWHSEKYFQSVPKLECIRNKNIFFRFRMQISLCRIFSKCWHPQSSTTHNMFWMLLGKWVYFSWSLYLQFRVLSDIQSGIFWGICILPMSMRPNWRDRHSELERPSQLLINCNYSANVNLIPTALRARLCRWACCLWYSISLSHERWYSIPNLW